MIGLLRGTVIEKQPPVLLVDVQGVGYEVEAPMSVFYDLPEPGAEVVLRTHLSIREDAHVLYGFTSERERALFRGLIRVNGVGPKLALTLLSGIRADDFIRCVELGDSATLTRLPGVGKKIAERLIMEMGDRLGDLSGSGVKSGIGVTSGATAETPADARGEALGALVALGYKPAEANRLLDGLADDATSEQLIRQALQKAVRP